MEVCRPLYGPLRSQANWRFLLLAEGFQTGVRRIRVTPEIAARLKLGEDVSPEEIAAASVKMDEL